MSKVEERQRFIRHWKDVTGETEVDMRKVAELAIAMGQKPPPPIDPVDAVAKQYRDAAKQDIRRDDKTHRPYRGYHAVPNYTADGQRTFSYIDIDDPKTKPERFKKSTVMRREQMIDDGVQLRLDENHWNGTRPVEQQIELLPMDLQPDIDWRIASLDHVPTPEPADA